MKETTPLYKREEALAFFAVLVSFGGLYWLLVALDLLPPWHAGLGSYLLPTPSHLAPFLLFWVSTSLVFALRSGLKAMLAFPYIALSCGGVVWLATVAVLKLIHSGSRATGGMPILLFLSLIIAVPMYLTHLIHRLDATRRSKAYGIGLTLQVLLSVGVGYFFAHHYGVWHLREPLRVEMLRLCDGPLTLPLVEEREAFLVDRRGNVYKIDLVTGRAHIVAKIPRLTEADGASPRPVRPYSEERQRNPFAKGVLTRVAPDELSFRYAYS